MRKQRPSEEILSHIASDFYAFAITIKLIIRINEQKFVTIY